MTDKTLEHLTLAIMMTMIAVGERIAYAIYETSENGITDDFDDSPEQVREWREWAEAYMRAAKE